METITITATAVTIGAGTAEIVAAGDGTAVDMIGDAITAAATTARMAAAGTSGAAVDQSRFAHDRRCEILRGFEASEDLFETW